MRHYLARGNRRRSLTMASPGSAQGKTEVLGCRASRRCPSRRISRRSGASTSMAASNGAAEGNACLMVASIQFMPRVGRRRCCRCVAGQDVAAKVTRRHYHDGAEIAGRRDDERQRFPVHRLDLKVAPSRPQQVEPRTVATALVVLAPAGDLGAVVVIAPGCQPPSCPAARSGNRLAYTVADLP